MRNVPQSMFQNLLVGKLSAVSFKMFSDHLEPIALPRGFVFSEPNEADLYCYFPESGIGSIVADGAEVGLFGREGMTPAALVLETDSTPFSVFMQVAGNGCRIETHILAAFILTNPSIRTVFAHYAQSLVV